MCIRDQGKEDARSSAPVVLLSNVRSPESETVYGSVLAEILSSGLALVESSFGDPLTTIATPHPQSGRVPYELPKTLPWVLSARWPGHRSDRGRPTAT